MRLVKLLIATISLLLLTPLVDTMLSLEEVSKRYLLTMTLWREARGESDEVKRAVCYSILRRVKLGGWWGSTIEAVVTKPLQYSSMTYPKDPQLVKYLMSTDPSAVKCWDVAMACLDGTAPNRFPTADSYYDISIPAPNWATPANFLGKIGRINFHQVRS